MKTKSRLFKIAHTVKAQFNSFSEALAHAWKVIKLQVSLQYGNVKFSYKKVSDGSIRNAVGTLQNTPETKGTKEPNYGLMVYFDLEANGWRSARIESILF